mmetsp:Transcript_12237/g.26651  ORF Transcript_12237/g.26651 Transcript_12237/m.26651 type:complete len:93 (+) Transcript_12237:2561-2839(+)|eukprot:CAMPEP_0116904368 /NCGR_PEP_ID=MMETSP0467-20121206/11381_1 /TAXON_ID=283647 /ORGANISM="Mesodinium pulex, Strain SPMC105" /LENGTH=92 /DNA_ID=CAMNT_0004579007 /DNA_START=2559 /DNA_END=2837 /DNA_ORIENTATION=+
MPSIINVVISILVGMLSGFMRYKTRTELVLQDMMKIFITTTLTYMIIPMVMQMNYYFLFIGFFKMVGLKEQELEWQNMKEQAAIIDRVDKDW